MTSRRVLPIFFAIGVLIVVNLVWLVPTLDNIRTSASVLALEVLNRAHVDTTSHLNMVMQGMEMASEEVALEPERADIVLGRLLKHYTNIRSVAIAAQDGREVQRTDRYQIATPDTFVDHSGEPYFIEALEGRAVFGRVFLSDELEPIMRLAVPIRGFGQREARVLVAELNLRALILAIRDTRVSGTIYLVDRDGHQVVHPDVTELLQRPNFSDRLIVQKVLEGEGIADGLAPEDEYMNEGGEGMFVVGKKIPEAGLGIFFEQPRSSALAAERQALILALIIMVLSVALVLFIGIFNVRMAVLVPRLRQALGEMDKTSKVLVRKDIALSKANDKLSTLTEELAEVGKILVRRDLDLSQANTRLQELDTVKSEFVSVAAHQLRTPLTGIRWSITALLQNEYGNVTAEQKKVLESAMVAVHSSIQLINDLLNVAHIEGGRFGFEFKTQKIATIVAEAVKNLEGKAGSKGVSLTFEGEDVNALVSADKEKLGMVFANLIDNAIKYTPPAGSITVVLQGDEKKVWVTVKDTGIGIPASEQHKLFEKFFRAPNAQLLQTAGTGLGLYLSKNVTEKHGGKIEVTSVENEGTTITVTIPIVNNDK